MAYRDNFSNADPFHERAGNPFNDSNTHIPLSSTNYGGQGAQSMTDLNASSYSPYHDAPGSSNVVEHNNNWMEPGYRASSGKRRWIIGGVILVALIVVGVAVGVSLTKKNSSTSSSSSSGSSDSSVVSQTNPNDPSTFEKDPNLHQVFYGIAYTPEGSQLPDCGNELSQVITDIQLMSQLTTRLRLYGADCNQSALVLEAIKQTKVNMSVFLGNYPIATDNGTAYQRQRDEIQNALQTYGTSNIAGITVGNEFILDYLNDNDGTNPNDAVGNAGAQMLIGFIQDTRQMLQGMNINLPVGTADAGAYFNNEVLGAVDYGMANVHPWFADVSIDQAAGWTYEFFQQTDVAAAQAVSNNPTMYIAETGWPSNSSDISHESNGPSNASIPNLQEFLDTFVCQSNANGTKYFYFEYFDELWKEPQFGGVERWWGIFNPNRTLKSGITIPTC